MKAKKNVPQQESHPAEAGQPFEWTSSSPTWNSLLNMLRNPSPDTTHTAASLAFGRILSLCNAMTVQQHSGFTETDWEGIAGAIELDASILRHAFEIMYRELHRRDRLSA